VKLLVAPAPAGEESVGREHYLQIVHAHD